MSTNAKIAIGLGVVFAVAGGVWYVTRARPATSTSLVGGAGAAGETAPAAGSTGAMVAGIGGALSSLAGSIVDAAR